MKDACSICGSHLEERYRVNGRIVCFACMTGRPMLDLIAPDEDVQRLFRTLLAKR